MRSYNFGLFPVCLSLSLPQGIALLRQLGKRSWGQKKQEEGGENNEKGRQWLGNPM